MNTSHDVAAAPPPDAAVIQASWHEPDRFAEIFHRYFNEVHRYIARRLGADVADDLAAETFLTAFRKRSRFDASRGAVRPWLYGIATNLFGPAMRSRLWKAAMARSGQKELSPSLKISVVAAAFENAPLSPTVRAGLMRALVAHPGVRTIGTVTDPLGRSGVALAAEVTPSTSPSAKFKTPDYGSRTELIFDRNTGGLLAEQEVLTKPGGLYRDQKPGFVINYSVTRNSGWTGTKPTPPVKRPF
ncbi:MAG: polymerase, sigma-24 subunit, subfamily [Actinomycetia bacterium]|nr:polymerase, sigma-24 subunit, subfamily [Actinomycetes bacterium]